MFKICLITPGHIASNPRLVKEAVALDKAGYQVHIIFTQNVDYLVPHDFKILTEHPRWTYDALNWTKLKTAGRFISGMVQKAAKILSKYQPNISILQLAVNRNYYWQLKKANLSGADLYIAHNLAALPVAFAAAKKAKAKCGFDAEDFHRQETTDDIDSLNYKTAKAIEDEFIPQLNYLTTASPLITSKYLELYPEQNPITINNVFSKIFIQKPQISNDENLRLFWFSQTIGKGRGIENAIKAIGLLKTSKVTLSLLGNINPSDKQYFLAITEKAALGKDQLKFISPIAADDIFEFAAQFDIGLALEPGFCLNNTIALSNKIFTYLISSVAIIATNTSAQERFMNTYQTIGKTVPNGDVSLLAAAINYFNMHRDELLKAKTAANHIALSELNWEIESLKFTSIISRILCSSNNDK